MFCFKYYFFVNKFNKVCYLSNSYIKVGLQDKLFLNNSKLVVSPSFKINEFCSLLNKFKVYQLFLLELFFRDVTFKTPLLLPNSGFSNTKVRISSGFSHLFFLEFSKILFLFFSKNVKKKITLFSYNRQSVNNFFCVLRVSFPVNMYKKKGLCLKTEIVQSKPVKAVLT